MERLSYRSLYVVSILLNSACSPDALEGCADPSMTEWERSRERDEFMRSAMLYKPNNSSLSSRFTRGKQEEDSDLVEVPRDQQVPFLTHF